MSVIEEPRTISAISNIISRAIERWVFSHRDCPDMNSHDGVSEIEAASQW